MTDDDFGPPSSHVSLSAGTAAGLAGVLIGCALLISACTLMTFNVILYSRGFRGIPVDLARVGAVAGVGGVFLLGVFAVVCAARGWSAAARSGESQTLSVAGTFAAGAGLIAWIVAGTNLCMIVFDPTIG